MLWTAVLPAADVRVQADQADGDDPAREDDVLPGPAAPFNPEDSEPNGRLERLLAWLLLI